MSDRYPLWVVEAVNLDGTKLWLHVHEREIDAEREYQENLNQMGVQVYKWQL